jgi:hypothetical protein
MKIEVEAEIEKFLRAVREHTGLFVERAPKRYGFMHSTFEEYYAARYLVARRREAAKLIRGHMQNLRWEEPILLALGFVGLDYPDDAAELLQTAILAEGDEAKALGFQPSLHEDLLGRDFLFALRSLGDQIPADTMLVRRLIARMTDELLYGSGRARFVRYRRALEDRLRSLSHSAAASDLAQTLICALTDRSESVRSRAAVYLGHRIDQCTG